MRQPLAAHLWWYNHERTNHALGGLLVPADRYYARAMRCSPGSKRVPGAMASTRSTSSVAGAELEREAQRYGPLTMGQVVWTGGYRLGCQWVAHAAAAADGAICIQRAVLRTLFEAERRGARSITFPALGTGRGGVPHGFGARLMLEAIRTFAAFEPRHCRAVTIALLDEETLGSWSTALTALDADAAVP